MIQPKFQKLDSALERGSFIEVRGTVSDVVGLVIESDGPNAAIGDVCRVEADAGTVPCEGLSSGFAATRRFWRHSANWPGFGRARPVMTGEPSGFNLACPFGRVLDVALDAR